MAEQSLAGTSAVLAPFIVWLARHGADHRLDSDQRRRCPGLVEQFLDWQHHQRAHRQPCDADTYRAHLAQQGATTDHITEAGRAIYLLEQYFTSGK